MPTKNKKDSNEKCNRAVIYARYSPGPNQREESIEGQMRECRDVAKRHGLTVVREYADRRMSGTNDERPDFQRMLRDADRKLFDVVITWKNDRFARNRYDAAIYKQRLKRNGVKIIYAKEIIPDGPEGIILESLLEGMAEYYSANLSQNIRRGQRENALEGKFIGGTIPLGYKLDAGKHYVLDPEKAPLVRQIFARYVNGESVASICEDLNSKGYTTARGNKFNRSSLHRMLANEKYTGRYRFDDIENAGAIPRIISDEQFKAAVARAEKNKIHKRAPQNAPVEFLLTGKLFCGHCGQPMGGTSATGRHGGKFYYYQCNGRKKGSCKKKAARKELLEKLVAETVLKNILSNTNTINKIVDRCMEIQLKEQEAEMSPVKSLRHELKETEKSLANIMKAIEAGIITTSTKSRLLELEERCAALKQGIAAAEVVPPKLSREQLLFIFERYMGRDAEDVNFMREVIDAFIDKIFVYDDKLVVTFNFSDETRNTITLTDIEKASAELLEADGTMGCRGSANVALTPPCQYQSLAKWLRDTRAEDSAKGIVLCFFVFINIFI